MPLSGPILGPLVAAMLTSAAAPVASPRDAELREVPPATAPDKAAPQESGGSADESAPVAPPMPPIEDIGPPPTSGGTSGAPTMPPVEDLPPRPSAAGAKASDGGGVVLGGPRGRDPVSGGGVGVFDPGKLGGDGPGTAGGGAIQIRGYLGLNFMVTERTNTSARDPVTGGFEQLKTIPYFGGGAANVFVGAPVYADVVYVRVAFEFLSIPRAPAGAADVAPAWSPVVLMESAALEVNPFTWAERSGRWFREGFKITGGVFIVPFGLEDEEHDAPVRWFVTRPLAMSVGRVYPGSWIDIGATVKWKPTFGSGRPIRPLEIDVGVINGDACTQTRAVDLLYRYQPVGQVDEVCEHRRREVAMTRADGAILGITPDNNGNKSFLARLQLRPIPALNFGASYIWGKHPDSTLTITDFRGKSFPESAQAATWRAGAHFDLNLDEVVSSRFPLPHIRAEVIYGVDAASADAKAAGTLSDRRMLGGYAQIAQPLFRRKKTRLPGLILQYRFDHADPDLAVPKKLPGGVVLSDFSDAYLYDEAMQAHVFGLRFPVLPRFTLKAEYGVLREDGGAKNQLHNDLFTFQAVADF